MKRPYIPANLRELVSQRAQGRCEYCQCPMAFSLDSFAVEHITPFTLGGASEESNLALACGGCNGHKHTAIQALDPLTLESVPLFHPRQHRWLEHFVWGTDSLYMVGLTPIGRATIERLNLNRPGIVNVRKLLGLVGEHPPDN